MTSWFTTERIEVVLARHEQQALVKASSARLERLRTTADVVIDEIVKQNKPDLPLIAYSEVTRSKPFEIQEKAEDGGVRLLTGLRVYLPFTGNRKMFFVASTTSQVSDYPFEPSIGQADDFITLLIKEDELTSEVVDKHLFLFHQDVEWNLNEMRIDIDAWVPDMRSKVVVAVEARKQRLSAISELESSLSMPVRHFKK